MPCFNGGVSDPLQELEARLERLNLLYQVSSRIHSTLDSREALDLILSEAVRLMRASSGSIVLFNPTSEILEIEAAHGLPPEAMGLKLRLGEGITGWVAQHGQAVRVGEVSQDPRYITARPNVRSELAVPLEVNGEVRGVLNVDSDRREAFSEADQQLLQELAVPAARVIQNTWLYEQYRLKARLFESLFNVGQTINSTLRLEEALQVITREACVLMEGKVCSLLMVDETREWLDLRAHYGAGPMYLAKPRLSVAESLVGVVVRRRKPLQVQNVQVSSRYQNVEVARHEGLVSMLSVPLVFGGQALGALSVYTGAAHSFSNEEIRIMSALAEFSAIAIEKARLYERVVDMEEQLRQSEKLSALGLLAAEVAHEIRNPLTVMKMLFHSLDLKFPSTDPRAKDAKVIGDKMDHLNRIVEQILDFARSNEPKPVSLNVNQLINDLSLLVRHKLSQTQVQLNCQLEPQLPAVMGDATQLEQVFLNLILNALEAMPKGGALTIATRTCRAPRSGESPCRVMIEFEDTGEGMTDEQRQRAFTSLLNTTKRKGTGLGLAIVAKIIEAHHGRIQLRSRLGQGTRFRIYLPA